MHKVPPVVLCILDGWGYRQNGKDNSIATAHTPHWDNLWNTCPHSLLEASAEAVGLPQGQMGNSEVGHMNLGAGRIIYQNLPRIDESIEESSLQANQRLQNFIRTLKTKGSTCHLMGLLSPGGIHAHQRHILELARIITDAGVPVVFHPFLDGRDTPPKSATNFLQDLEDFCKSRPLTSIATVAGRYYAMDRDNRWERTQLSYDAIVNPTEATPIGPSAIGILENSYNENITDEFVVPSYIDGYEGMSDGDGILMANFRADRARQILEAFLNPSFTHFPRPKNPKVSAALGMVDYSSQHQEWMEALFPAEQPENTLGEIIANQGLKQLRTAETEKYAHVTFFFNGGRESPFPLEDRILIPSPKVATYDLKPEMSAPELTEKLVEAIQSEEYALIVVNYANTDMVGHTGEQTAAEKAVEAVDHALGQIVKATHNVGGTLLVTADHGNVEVMRNPESDGPHTAHTMNPVPLVIYGKQLEGCKLSNGILADVAPTVLHLMNIPQPSEMTGKSLITC